MTYKELRLRKQAIKAKLKIHEAALVDAVMNHLNCGSYWTDEMYACAEAVELDRLAAEKIDEEILEWKRLKGIES